MRVETLDFPDDLLYVRGDHLWLRREGSRLRVGLDALAAASAGDILYIKFQPAGRNVARGRTFGSLEAGKFVGPLKSPVSGALVETNPDAASRPAIVNRDPYGAGWLALLEPENAALDTAGFLSGAAVEAWVKADLASFRSKGWLPP